MTRQADPTPLAGLAEPYARPAADDAAFYAQPRLVDHLDTTARERWRDFSGRFVRVAWVLRHLQRAGFAALHTESQRGRPRPADDKYIRQTRFADPLYAVWGAA